MLVTLAVGGQTLAQKREDSDRRSTIHASRSALLVRERDTLKARAASKGPEAARRGGRKEQREHKSARVVPEGSRTLFGCFRAPDAMGARGRPVAPIDQLILLELNHESEPGRGWEWGFWPGATAPRPSIGFPSGCPQAQVGLAAPQVPGRVSFAFSPNLMLRTR
ncbi:hypothetical protein MRX96_058575 [Rhipicephalus microplus]